MPLAIRTITVPTSGVLVRTGMGSVTLVNRSTSAAMRVATSTERLGSAETCDEIPAGGSIEMDMTGRRDELHVAAVTGTIAVAVYEA